MGRMVASSQLEQGALYERVDLSLPWDNQSVIDGIQVEPYYVRATRAVD